MAGTAAATSIFRYDSEKFCEEIPVGEVIELGKGFSGSFSLISGAVSLLALGLYALLQGDTGNNDDDDSGPGGGLMQPVA